MAVIVPVHQCVCTVCKNATDAALAGQHRRINVLLSRLNESQRRWYVGSLLLAPNGPTEAELSLITGMDEKTIRRGRRELDVDLADVPAERQRQVGGGRLPAEKKTPR